MSFVSYIVKCLSPDAQSRQEGENFFLEKLNENFVMCFDSCCDLLINENENTQIRQFCATFIKSILSKPEYIEIWEKTPVEQKNNLKTKILSCLASNANEIRSATSLVISTICRIELQKDQWKDIIPVLCSAAQHENNNFRISSLMTISYILQDLEIPKLPPEDINNIVKTLIDNLDPSLNQEVFNQAIIAFRNLLDFLSDNFKQEAQRKFLIDKIIALLNDTRVDNQANPKSAEYLLQCLIEIARKYYDCLDDCISSIANVTFRYAKNYNNTNLSIQGIEFWCSLTDEEIYNKTNRMSSLFQEELSNICEYVLSHRDENYELLNKDSWNTVKAVRVLIGNLSVAQNEKFINKQLTFIGTYLDCQNDLMRDSAYLSFVGLLENPYLNTEVVVSSIDKLFTNLKNERKEMLVSDIVWCFFKICEVHTANLFDQNEKFFHQIVKEIINLINSGSILKIGIAKLVESIDVMIKQITNPDFLDQVGEELLDTLLKTAYMPGANDPNINVSHRCFCAMADVLDKAGPNLDQPIKVFFSKIYELFGSTFDPNNLKSKKEKETYQEYLCSLISSASLKFQMNNEQLFSVYNLIKQTFIDRQCVYEEGINAISSLASSPSFENVMKDFFPFLTIALDMKDSPLMCRTALLATSTIIRQMGEKIQPNLEMIIQKTEAIINDMSSDRNLKPICFLVLTDIFNLKINEPYMYFSQAMNVVSNAMTACVQKAKDQEMYEYLDKLKENLLEFLTSVNFYLEELNKKDDFGKYVEMTIRFINTICSKEYSPKYELVSLCLGLVCDLVIYFPGLVKAFSNNETIINMREIMRGKTLETKNKEEYEWCCDIIDQFSLA